MEYRQIGIQELNVELFDSFQRRQVVTKCWRKENGTWVIKDIHFIEQWTQMHYQKLVECLINTLNTGGVVYGCFIDGKLKGFVSVEAKPLGSRGQYLNLSSIHVSQEMRSQGIGRKLFELASSWAREHGARKLYISAHSSVESQAFYHKMGCVEAKEYDQRHVKEEPCDCQLEYSLYVDESEIVLKKFGRK